MRLVIVVVALIVAGCASPGAPASGVAASGEAIQLLTGNPLGGDACYTNSVIGMLNADQTYGTTLTLPTKPNPDTSPVMWPPGYTAQWVGSEVEVSDASGKAVATTGQPYQLSGGFVSPKSVSASALPSGFPDDGAFWACGPVSSQ